MAGNGDTNTFLDNSLIKQFDIAIQFIWAYLNFYQETQVDPKRAFRLAPAVTVRTRTAARFPQTPASGRRWLQGNALPTTTTKT